MIRFKGIFSLADYSASTVFSPVKIYLIGSVFALVLVGCGGVSVMVPTQQEILLAERESRLEEVYNELLASGSQSEEVLAAMANIAGLIAEQGKSDIDAQILNMQQFDQGLLAYADLDELTASAQAITKWDEDIASELIASLDFEAERTDRFISQSQTTMDSQSASLNDRYLAAVQAATLSGQDAGRIGTQVLSSAFSDAQALFSRSEWQAALSLANEILDLDQSFQGVSEFAERSAAEVEAEELIIAVNGGNPEAALGSYRKLTLLPSSVFPSERVASPASQLMQYFANNSANGLAIGDLTIAFENLLLAQEIASPFDWSVQETSGVLVELMNRAVSAAALDRVGLSVSYLLAAREIAPTDRELQVQYEESLAELHFQAVRRMNVAGFTSTAGYPDIGSQISSLVRERLSSASLDSLEIIEREALSNILREQEIRSIEGGESLINITSADVVIEGSITQVAVETDRENVTERQRVVVSTESEPNPDYEEWLNTNERDRSEDEPDRFVEVDVTEDVSIDKTYITKTGLISISYRAIDPISARLTQIQTVRREYRTEGEAIAGVQIGDFVQETVRANLMSDLDILNILVSEAASEISEALIEVYGAAELDYLSSADSLIEDGEDIEAVEFYAKSFALTPLEDLDSVVIDRMTTIALANNPLFL